MLSNPGAAGSNGLPSITAFHRQQWVGFEGAPLTDALSFNSPLLAGRVGVGLTVANEQIGFFNLFSAQLAYAYRVTMAGGSLGIGLHASMNRLEAKLSEVRTISGTVNGSETILNPSFAYNLGMGIHFENEHFFIGMSVPQVLDRGQANGQVRHFFGNIGGVLELSEKLRMRSAAAVRVVKNAPPSFDTYLGFGFTEDARLWLGGMLRSSKTQDGVGGDALVALGQYQVSERLRAGLAYDFGLGAVRHQNVGTFELMLEYCFVKAAQPERILKPRYF